MVRQVPDFDRVVRRSAVEAVERAVEIETSDDSRVPVEAQIRAWVIGLGDVPYP